MAASFRKNSNESDKQKNGGQNTSFRIVHLIGLIFFCRFPQIENFLIGLKLMSILKQSLRKTFPIHGESCIFNLILKRIQSIKKTVDLRIFLLVSTID